MREPDAQAYLQLLRGEDWPRLARAALRRAGAVYEVCRPLMAMGGMMAVIGKGQPGDIDYQACGLHRPGHQVHFIQAKKAWEGDQVMYKAGRLVRVDDDGWITVEAGADVLRFWNHDPKRAKQCFAASAGHVGLPGWGLLHPPDQEGRYCICVSTDGPTPCVPPTAPTTDPEELLKQLETYGGFMAEVNGIPANRDIELSPRSEKL